MMDCPPDHCMPPSSAYVEYTEKHKNYTLLERVQLLLIENDIIFIPKHVSEFAKNNKLIITGLHEWFNGVTFIRRFYGKYTIYETHKANLKVPHFIQEDEIYYILANDKEVRLATPKEIKRFSNCPYF